MAGLKGNVAWLAAAKQTAKGTPNTTYTYAMPFVGGNIQPTREVARLSETDSSRDVGIGYMSQVGVEGTPEVYVRDASIGFWGQAALGLSTPSGTTNYTHVQTPANTLPYLTLARNIGDLLWEQFNDCKVTSLTLRASATEPLTAAIGVTGRSTIRLTSAPTIPALAAETPYNYNDSATPNGTVTIGAVTTYAVSAFETTVENNVNYQWVNSFVPYDLVEGQRTATLGFDLIMEDLVEYNKFHYGGAAGTTQSGTLFETTATFMFYKTTNNSLKIEYLHLIYEEFPVEPSAAGDPVVVSVRGSSQRNAVDPVIKITLKNQVATY